MPTLPIKALAVLALGLVALAPSFALENNQCYSSCKARCVARYACEGRHRAPNCFTNFNKCRTGDAPDFVEVGEAGIAMDDAMRRQGRVQLVG